MPWACSEVGILEGDESPISGTLLPRSFGFGVLLEPDRRCLKETPWIVDLDVIRCVPIMVQPDPSSLSMGTRPSPGDSLKLA